MKSGLSISARLQRDTSGARRGELVSALPRLHVPQPNLPRGVRGAGAALCSLAESTVPSFEAEASRRGLAGAREQAGDKRVLATCLLETLARSRMACSAGLARAQGAYVSRGARLCVPLEQPDGGTGGEADDSHAVVVPANRQLHVPVLLRRLSRGA